MIAAGAAGILVLVVAVLFYQTSLILEPAPESDTLNVPRPDGEILVDLSSPQIYSNCTEKLLKKSQTIRIQE